MHLKLSGFSQNGTVCMMHFLNNDVVEFVSILQRKIGLQNLGYFNFKNFFLQKLLIQAKNILQIIYFTQLKFTRLLSICKEDWS